MVTSNCRHPGYKTKDPINTFWRSRLQVIERLFAHCMETTPYTLFELEEHIQHIRAYWEFSGQFA
jgi:hypothetical protein